MLPKEVKLEYWFIFEDPAPSIIYIFYALLQQQIAKKIIPMTVTDPKTAIIMMIKEAKPAA